MQIFLPSWRIFLFSTAVLDTHLVQNNVIIANRNDILDNLFSPDFEQTIQGQIEKEIKP